MTRYEHEEIIINGNVLDSDSKVEFLMSWGPRKQWRVAVAQELLTMTATRYYNGEYSEKLFELIPPSQKYNFAIIVKSNQIPLCFSSTLVSYQQLK